MEIINDYFVYTSAVVDRGLLEEIASFIGFVDLLIIWFYTLSLL